LISLGGVSCEPTFEPSHPPLGIESGPFPLLRFLFRGGCHAGFFDPPARLFRHRASLFLFLFPFFLELVFREKRKTFPERFPPSLAVLWCFSQGSAADALDREFRFLSYFFQRSGTTIVFFLMKRASLAGLFLPPTFFHELPPSSPQNMATFNYSSELFSFCEFPPPFQSFLATSLGFLSSFSPSHLRTIIVSLRFPQCYP